MKPHEQPFSTLACSARVPAPPEDAGPPDESGPPALDCAPSAEVDVRLARDRLRHQRFAERQVEVHRSGRGTGGFADRAPRQGARISVAHGLRRARRLLAPAREARIQRALLHRLRSTPRTQLRRTVSGHYHQRDARVRRLGHGGQEIGTRSPGRADQQHRPPRGLGETQCVERGIALVDVDGVGQPRQSLPMVRTDSCSSMRMPWDRPRRSNGSS